VPTPPLARTLLVLGRVSNLPTVWSNCLAGWLLGGGGAWPRFAQLSAGASLLYTGGMFLNDACDVWFDVQHRKERPIPSGAIATQTVWMLGFVFLLGGAALLAPLGTSTALLAFGLAGCIALYDLVHKRIPFAPALMAACRFLLYLLAGSAALNEIRPRVYWCAGALAAYIVGLSLLARKESQQTRVKRCPLFLLLAPIVTALLLPRGLTTLGILFSVLLLIWLGLCFRFLSEGRDGAIGRAVSGLLAGIVLVDMLAVHGGGGWMPLAFLALFASALIMQRTIPAT
jgi:4-hydroxybenzoate polyprenyltransferase